MVVARCSPHHQRDPHVRWHGHGFFSLVAHRAAAAAATQGSHAVAQRHPGDEMPKRAIAAWDLLGEVVPAPRSRTVPPRRGRPRRLRYGTRARSRASSAVRAACRVARVLTAISLAERPRPAGLPVRRARRA
jgi:hypothetical protein